MKKKKTKKQLIPKNNLSMHNHFLVSEHTFIYHTKGQSALHSLTHEYYLAKLTSIMKFTQFHNKHTNCMADPHQSELHVKHLGKVMLQVSATLLALETMR